MNDTRALTESRNTDLAIAGWLHAHEKSTMHVWRCASTTSQGNEH